MTSSVPPTRFQPDDHTGSMKFASGILFLDGLYLVISAAIGHVNAGNAWNGIIAGIVILVLAGARFARAGAWTAWIDALIGVWLIISPWVYGYGTSPWKWNTIIVGIIAVVFGVWSALATAPTRRIAA